jgi:hypothetical protein
MCRAPIAAGLCIAALSCGPRQPNPTGPNPIPTTSAVPVASAKPAANGTKPVPPIDLANVGVPLPNDDVCEKNPDGTIKNPIPAGKYKGLLRNAKCEQQKFLTMAYMIQELGIKDCSHCHVVNPNATGPADKFLFAEPTEKKRIANWMLATFIQGLARVDEKPMTCASCHNDGKGKGRIKILYDPRKKDFAQEWMNEVMTATFTCRSSERLRCKTCHVGMAPNQAGWNPHVLVQLEATPEGNIVRIPGAP